MSQSVWMRGVGASVMALSLAAAAGSCWAAAAPVDSPVAQKRLTLPDDVAPIHYAITVKPDLTGLTFTGALALDIEVKRATPTIVLNAADLEFTRVDLDGQRPTRIRLDPVQQTVAFDFAAPVQPGKRRLNIDYTGRIYQQASGLFALDYTTKTGKARALFTQFENSDARRFTPSFDEPGQKATFSLSADVPADLMALSNMPVAATTPLPGGLKHVRFGETPKMSSYLLFFGLGDFERVSRKVDGVDVGVVVKRGDADEAGFALDAASQILPYYNSYFGTKYPLPKLDLIGGPGQSQFFGAMENWGAIFYFERYLLIDPRTATEDDRQNVYIVVAHEMAHQWFGDLVTMAWWDDLWLNEGFASWMENKVTDHFHPEWKVWLSQLNAKNKAMQLDAKAGTHPVVRPIYDILQASGAFDDITYDKGASVIRMLESYTGEDAWRAGIRDYIARHAYANAVTDDLWRAIDAQSPRKITDIAHDFTLQAGVPLIQAGSQGGELRLTQGRFGLDPQDLTPRAWRTPVALEGQGERIVSAGEPWGAAARPGAIVNAGQVGYFRTRYDAKAFAAVADRYAGLSADDELGILNDTQAEADAGDVPMGDYLTLVTRLPADPDPLVVATLAGQLAGFDRLYEGLPGQARFRAFAIDRLAGVQRRLGWEPKAGEPANTGAARIAVLSALGRMGDASVIAGARSRFQTLVDGGALDPAVRRAVLAIVAANADAADWDKLHDLARKAPTQLERIEYYELLGAARDEALGRRALALALTSEAEPTTRPGIIASLSRYHPNEAFDFTAAHWAQIEPLLDSSARVGYVTRLAAASPDPAMAGRLDAFAAAHISATGRGEVEKAKAQIAYTAKVRAERLPEVDRWLAAHPPARP